jgi:hypothetical protein
MTAGTKAEVFGKFCGVAVVADLILTNAANMHRGPQTLPSDWGVCIKVEYKEATDFFSSKANSVCYPGGIHISGLVQRGKHDVHEYIFVGNILD